MKHLLLSFSLFLLSAIALPAFAADWSLVSHGNTQTLSSIAFDGPNLIAAGNKGTVLLSSDNGKTWTVSTTNATSTWLFGATGTSNGNLIVVGENSAAIRSTDHGKTWSKISIDATGNLYSVSSKNQTGYMVGAGGIFFVRNAITETWDKYLIGTQDDLYGVQDMGDGTGWAVGANGTLMHIGQSGFSSGQVVLITKETLRSVKFSDLKNGWIVGTKGTILHTSDGGFTWNSVAVSGVTDQTLYAVDAQGSYVTIAGEKILVTSDDGGATWNVKSFAGTFDTFYGAATSADGTRFAVGTDYDVASLIFMSSTAVTPPPAPVVPPGIVVTATPNTLVKLHCSANAAVNDPCKAVYYYATDSKRHAFPNEKVYFSWFPDFSAIQEVSADFLASLPLGKNVTYHPGMRMVKFQTSPQVYVVAKGGVLRAVLSESIAAALYGSNWNKQIDDISDAFYGNYKFGEPVVNGTDYDPAQARSSVSNISENF